MEDTIWTAVVLLAVYVIAAIYMCRDLVMRGRRLINLERSHDEDPRKNLHDF